MCDCPSFFIWMDYPWLEDLVLPQDDQQAGHTVTLLSILPKGDSVSQEPFGRPDQLFSCSRKFQVLLLEFLLLLRGACSSQG